MKTKEIWSRVNPSDHWYCVDNGDGTTVDATDLPTDNWVCSVCKEYVGYVSYYTNTYSGSTWVPFYTKSGVDIFGDVRRVCCECGYGLDFDLR